MRKFNGILKRIKLGHHSIFPSQKIQVTAPSISDPESQEENGSSEFEF
jgi:hypothetical protein